MDREPTAIVDSSGDMKIDYTKGLAIDVWTDGRIEVGSTEKEFHRLLASNGDTLIESNVQPSERLGKRDAPHRHGLPHRRERMGPAPQTGNGSPFHGSEKRALFESADGARIIDIAGGTIADIPDGDWRWPADMQWLVVFDSQENVTRYADIDGKETLLVDGRTGPFRRAVILRKDDMNSGSEWIGHKGRGRIRRALSRSRLSGCGAAPDHVLRGREER